MGIGGIPIINCENACASSATAFHLAWLYIASGMYDVVLALGMEKLYHADKRKSFAAIGSAVDIELMEQMIAEMNAQQAKLQGRARGPRRERRRPAGRASRARCSWISTPISRART